MVAQGASGCQKHMRYTQYEKKVGDTLPAFTSGGLFIITPLGTPRSSLTRTLCVVFFTFIVTQTRTTYADASFSDPSESEGIGCFDNRCGPTEIMQSIDLVKTSPEVQTLTQRRQARELVRAKLVLPFVLVG